jgi:hypothetical protein
MVLSLLVQAMQIPSEKNVRCNENGKSVFTLVVANALTGPGALSKICVQYLEDSNVLND